LDILSYWSVRENVCDRQEKCDPLAGKKLIHQRQEESDPLWVLRWKKSDPPMPWSPPAHYNRNKVVARVEIALGRGIYP